MRSSMVRYMLLALGLAVAALATTTPGPQSRSHIEARADQRPCDIYAAGGTPCVAAHGLTRALWATYSGRLYQLLRGDGATKDIFPDFPGGTANVADQDLFCTNQTCCISIIYDQSGHNNDLYRAPSGSAGGGPEPYGTDELAGAYGAPVTLNGKRAYGMFGSPNTGYRQDETSLVATGNDAEGMYALFDGTHYNQACCFDYGNAETNNTDPGDPVGDGMMEALYFGKGDGWSGNGTGSGPWVMADLENWLFAGGEQVHDESGDPTMTSRFVTGVLKGDDNNQWAIKSGDGNQGDLTTIFDGPRPSGPGYTYNPMKKQGAIVLGIGGDNSHGSQGTFYEGAMVIGYPSDETDAQIQANIIAAGYAQTDLNIGSTLTLGSIISFQVTTPGLTDRLLAHTGEDVNTQVISSSDPTAQWNVTTGLGNAGCFSFQSIDTPTLYIRHKNYQLYVDPQDGTQQTNEDATWCTQPGVNGQGMTIRSWSYSARYIRHYNAIGYLAANGGFEPWDTTTSFLDDASWLIIPH